MINGQNPTNVFSTYANLIENITTSEDLEAELSEQETVIQELKEAVKNKTAGGNVKLNIYTQTTEPTDKNGIWLQTSGVAEHYKSDDSIYFSGNWSTTGDTADIPYDFSGGSAVAIGTDIYLLGSNNSNYKKYAYKYNTLTNTYTKLTNIPYDFSGGSAVVIDTEIYLLGGGSSIESNYKYNTLTNTYTQLANMPHEFSNGSAVAIGTDIYLFGSSCRSSYMLYAYKYNTLTNTYTKLTNIPYEFYSGSAVAIGTDIYLFGGYYYKRYTYKYNILTNTYTQLANIPYDFYNGGVAVVIGTDIYLFGGSGNNTGFYKYNTLTNTYTQLTNIPYNFYYGAAVVIGTDIYLFGGNGGKTKTRIYHIQTKTYNTDNTVIIAQGRKSTGTTYNTGYAVKLLNTTFDEGFEPLYGVVDAWFYTTQDGVDTTIPTYYGDGTQWIKFKN